MTRGRWHVDERLASLTAADFDSLKAEHGGLNKAADALGISRETLKGRARRLLRLQPYQVNQMKKSIKHPAPRTGVKRFIFSSAQNGTAIDENFLTNLEAYATYLGAEIHIAGFTYGKSLFEDHSKSIARYHERVEPYLTNRSFDIAGKLLFCGEMNILPTADKPLSGFQAYTREKWGIFPHPRVILESVPVMWGAPPKIIMTTGAVTKKNYIQKKAGIKAEFHHVIGAVLVEIDDDGDFFCRHLIAAKDGSFQDLTIQVNNGRVTKNHRVQGITWGDLHSDKLDPDVAKGSWGLDFDEMRDGCTTPRPCMLDALAPFEQHFHDVLNFRRRNHHTIKDPHHMYEMWARGTESVEDEVADVATVLTRTSRPFSTSYIIDSNHDRALKRWLKEADPKKDPVNARYYHHLEERVEQAIDERDPNFLLSEWAIRETLSPKLSIKFLKKTDSHYICKVIQCALHGDLGANGAKGNIYSFAKMGPKATIAHTHAAAIYEGIYQVGTSSEIDMVYNAGALSSWNNTHCIAYRNGKRTLITMQNGKWRA